jgi:hypothetical protein
MFAKTPGRFARLLEVSRNTSDVRKVKRALNILLKELQSVRKATCRFSVIDATTPDKLHNRAVGRYRKICKARK